MTALVYLTRNAVLRARETYADVRASVWDGPTGALRRVLEALPHPKGARWRSVLRVHPDPDQRRQALDDTDRMFRMGFWDAFGTGIAATIAFQDLDYLLSALAPMAESFWTWLGAAFVFAPLAVGVVGLGVWRGTFAALARGRAPRGMGRLGLALGLGAILGHVLSIVTYIVSKSEDNLTGWTLFTFDLLWNGLLLISLFIFFRWVAAGASAWLEVAAAGRSPRPVYWLGLVIAGGLLAVWLASVYRLQDLRVSAASTTTFLEAAQEILEVDLSGPKGEAFFLLSSFITSIFNPLNFVGLVIMCAYPLAAWFGRRRAASTSGSSWAFLDPSPQPLELPRQPPLRPGLALVVGAVGGVIFDVLSFILVIGFGLVLASPDLLGGWTFFGQPAVAALIQAGVAAVVAGWVKRLNLLHALCAAFVAGCVMAGGILAITSFTGVHEWSLLVSLAASAIGGGTLLALPAAWSVSVIAGWARR